MSETVGPWRFSRRDFVSSVLGVSGTLLTPVARGQTLPMGTPGVAIYEITMAAPDIVCVEIRDQPVIKGALVTLRTPDAGEFNTWLTRVNPTTGRSDRCMVVGPRKMNLRFQDIQPTKYLSRSRA